MVYQKLAKGNVKKVKQQKPSDYDFMTKLSHRKSTLNGWHSDSVAMVIRIVFHRGNVK